MASGTIQETTEEITLQNPEPIRVASKRVQKRLTTLVHRYLDLQLAWEKRTVWLNEMLGKMQNWLGRDDLPNDIKNDGEQIERELEWAGVVIGREA
ncbi:hypothetical protein DS901_12680 [Loktanella sp. D2R18]|nr:hypothetical protein DS901_12680 [Loktanella sp. D2R18]